MFSLIRNPDFAKTLDKAAGLHHPQFRFSDDGGVHFGGHRDDDLFQVLWVHVRIYYQTSIFAFWGVLAAKTMVGPS